MCLILLCFFIFASDLRIHFNHSGPPSICATVYDGTNQSGPSLDLPIGDFDAGDRHNPFWEFRDRTESVSVTPIESFQNHAYA